jgi:uncharacterized protein
MTKLKFRRVTGNFAICRLSADASLPEWAQAGPFLSVTRTAEELSLVCPSDNVPTDAQAERGWACFKLEGPFPFLVSGILASFIGPLAQNGIPIFAVSTFDTDYVLLKKDSVGTALPILAQAGHEFI